MMLKIVINKKFGKANLNFDIDINLHNKQNETALAVEQGRKRKPENQRKRRIRKKPGKPVSFLCRKPLQKRYRMERRHKPTKK